MLGAVHNALKYFFDFRIMYFLLTITFRVPSKLTVLFVLKWGEITVSLLKTDFKNHFKVPECVDTTR